MVEFSYHSGIYTLKVKQELKMSLDKAWSFFSNPNNLSKITPENMGFNITSDIPKLIYEGQIITYKVSPFLGLKMNWVTEITHIKDKEYFIDEQRFGPYSMWHHEHYFKSKGDKTEIIDKVSFKVPFSFIGRLFTPIIVIPQLKKIFNHRTETLHKKYNHE